MKSSDIARVTHSSYRTVNRAFRLSRLTGSVVQRPLQLEAGLSSGRPRLLTALNAAVSHAVVCTLGSGAQSHQCRHCVGSSVQAKFLFDADSELDSQGY